MNGEKEPAGRTDLMRLVDRYRAMLEDIAGYKIRAASLGGSAAARKRMQEQLDIKSGEAEELEREIEELRAKILTREGEIRRLGKPGKDKGGEGE